MIKKLSRNEFEDAIKKGLGRAALHAQHYGLEGIDDIMLNACLHDLSFGPSYYAERSPWLLNMFKNTPFYEVFAEKVIIAFKQFTDEDESADFYQVYDLLTEMGIQGDNLAAQTLRDKIYIPKNVDYWRNEYYARFIDLIIRLDGTDAYVWLVKQLGGAILKLKDDIEAINDILSNAWNIPYHDEELKNKVFAPLYHLKNDNPAIAAFLHHESLYNSRERIYKPPSSDEERRQKRRENILKHINLQKILKGDVPSPYRLGYYPLCRSFGIYALPEELETIHQKLIDETDERLCSIWLCVFHETPLPGLHSRIWEIANSANKELRRNTLRALAQVKNIAVGEFARQLIQSKKIVGNKDETLHLFMLNYIQGDEKLIWDAIQNTTFENDDHLHDISFDIANILRYNSSPALLHLALWLYETAPCDMCRERAVEWIVDQKLLPEHIWQECLHDVCKDIRELASTYITMT